VVNRIPCWRLTYWSAAGGTGSAPRWDSSQADAIVGDWNNVLVGMRQDVSIQSFNTGVISDSSGVVQANLLQMNATAVRLVMRVVHLQDVVRAVDLGVPVTELWRRIPGVTADDVNTWIAAAEKKDALAELASWSPTPRLTPIWTSLTAARLRL
jgi:hypothetical protein